MTLLELHEKMHDLAAVLFEHCDAVQIMVSYNEEGTTHLLNKGAGNWYARQGMAHEFIGTNQAQNIAHEIALTNKDK